MLQGRSIFVVEDEIMVLINIEDILKDHGCTRITSAATVEQALEILETLSFDAAVLDVNLDGKMSHSVADELSARRIPFVVSTGYWEDALDGRYRNQPVLRKPYRDDALLNALAQLLGR
ncbi:MAG: response regulator [Pseudomonadota bacterium]|nr:response regulator [Pseudomonadota bacterium]